jgi:hypothetical protein
VDTRVDGDTGSRSTEAVNVFVAGGNPSGGTIANSAESRWRETHGADRFLGPLKRSQKAAAGEAQERWARPGGFELLDATGSSSHVVWAPLLGAHGTGPPPAPYHADHMEFRRAYRVAFLHWLRTRGAGSKKSSAEAFARFARTLAGGASAAEAIEEGYGLPLSAPSPAELLAADTLPLEGRFLVWLSKQ